VASTRCRQLAGPLLHSRLGKDRDFWEWSAWIAGWQQARSGSPGGFTAFTAPPRKAQHLAKPNNSAALIGRIRPCGFVFCRSTPGLDPVETPCADAFLEPFLEFSFQPSIARLPAFVFRFFSNRQPHSLLPYRSLPVFLFEQFGSKLCRLLLLRPSSETPFCSPFFPPLHAGLVFGQANRGFAHSDPANAVPRPQLGSPRPYSLSPDVKQHYTRCFFFVTP
jgi:hypothetical protein